MSFDFLGAPREAGGLGGAPSVQYANSNCSKVVDLEVGAGFCKGAGRDFVVHDNYESEVHPSESYKKFLSDLGFDPEDAEGEIRGFHCFKHVMGGGLVFFPRVVGGCLNSWRWNKSVRNMASRKLRKIMLVGVRWVGMNVLTFPGGVSRMMVDDPETVEKLCRSAGEIFYKKLCRSYGANLGCQMNFHPWSSKNPLYPHCHLHFDMLGAVVRNKKLHHLSAYAFKNESGQGVPFDIDLWRGIWVDALKEVFSPEKLVLDDGSPLTSDNVDTRFHWEGVSKKNKGHVLNRFKYRDRRPLVDLSVFFQHNSFSGVPYPVYSKYVVNYENNVRTFGFWNKLKTFMSDDARNKIDEKPDINCPVCDEKIVYVRLCYCLGDDIGIVRIMRDNRMLYSYKKSDCQRWLNEFIDCRTDEERLNLMNSNIE